MLKGEMMTPALTASPCVLRSVTRAQLPSKSLQQSIRAPYPAPATKTESNQPNNPNNRANWLIINLYLAKRGLFTILLAENKYKCYHQDCSTTESFILFSFSSTQERK